MKLKISDYIVISDSNGLNADEAKRIIYSTRTEKGISITNHTLELLEKGAFTSIPDRLFTILMYHEIIVPEDEDELLMVLKRKTLASIDLAKLNNFINVYPDLEVKEKYIGNFEKAIELLNKNHNSDRGLDDLLLRIFSTRNVEVGLEYFNLIRRHVSESSIFSNFQINYELNISATDLSKIFELLPLNNPGCETINFIFDSESGSSLQHFLSPIISCYKFHNYFKHLKINLFLTFNYNNYSEILESIQLFKFFSTENARIHFIPRYTSDLNFEKLDKMELGVLRALSQAGTFVEFIPTSDSKYHANKASSLKNKLIERSPAIIDFSTISRKGDVRDFYDDTHLNYFLNQKTKCGRCLHLPICGGRINKRKKDDIDCPTFVRNFMEKVKHHYKL